MAGDWIKIQKCTPDKPEIRQISRLCKCDKPKAFFAFFKFFSWLDEETPNGNVEFLTKPDADEIAGLIGFGDAIEAVHWVEFSDHGAMVLNWDRHNGQGAKNRVLIAEKKRRQRMGEQAPSAIVVPVNRGHMSPKYGDKCP